MSKFGGSKYRHIAGTVQKKELWYPDLKPTTGGGEATTIAASPSWIAVSWSSAGSIALLQVDQPGKRKTIDLPMIYAHPSELSDLTFSPFRDDILASSAEDATVKLWTIPENTTQNLTTATVILSGHKRRADSIKFHPTANNVIASGSSDKTLRIWDIEAGKEQIVIDGAHTDVIQSIDWSYDGSLLCTVSKDKKVRVIDPRAKTVAQTGEGHQGVKASRVAWLGDLNRIATSGFSKFRERQFAIWDARDLAKPLCMPTLDSSTGIIDLFYDQDTRILVLAGKGDGGIKLVEMGDGPYYSDLTNVQSDVAQKCAAVIPKRGVDLMNTEIIRLLKLTTNSVAPVSFAVPRKTKSEFQEDLYPPTASGEPVLTSQEWFSGENKTPKLIQLKPTSNPHKFWEQDAVVTAEKKEEKKEEKSTQVSTPAPQKTVVEMKPVEVKKTVNVSSPNSPRDGKTEIQPTNSPYVPKVVKVVRSSKFRHISGKGTKTDDCYTNLKINSAVNNSVIRANPLYFSVPWQGSGGLVALIPISKTGRYPDSVPFIECGSQCLDFDFNPFNHNVFATTTESAYLQIWKVPSGGLTKTVKDPDVLMKGHLRRVTSVDFHPTVSNIVVTSSGDSTIRFWDIEKASECLKLEGPADTVQSITWNWNGSLMAIASKEKELKIYDPRSNGVVDKTMAHEGAKGFKAVWLGNKEKIVTVGYSKTSERQISLWDSRKLSESLQVLSIDVGSGMITPFYDPDINVVYLSGRGDGNIKMYEIEEESPYIHYLTDFGSNIPCQGVAMLPKTSVNVKECEIARFIKLCSDYAEPLSFKVPRTRMEFFQDDLYPPTKKPEPTLNSTEWLSGKNMDPELFSLQPKGMKFLSDAPVETKTKKYEFNPNQPEELTRDKVLDKFYQQVDSIKESDGQVLKQDLMEGVEASEWD